MNISRCRAEIQHDALRHNARALRNFIGENPGIIAIVKADGYGHGASEVTKTLAPFAEQFGVATLSEAQAVRASAPDHDILLLSPCLPEERADAVREGFIPVVSSAHEAADYAAFHQGQSVRVHLCVDTGMGRIGIWQDNALAEAQKIAALKSVEIESVSTHLPSADSDPDFTTEELEGWAALTAKLRVIFPQAKFHGLNSAAALKWPRFAMDRVRAGLVLYGVSPLTEFQKFFQPAMTLKTRITLVREIGAGRSVSYGRDFVSVKPMRVATLAAGYADGYPRQVSGRGAQTLVRGVRCPVLGRITMDQFVIDISALPDDVVPGEEAVLFGRQGDAEITVDEVAALAGTISWDILTGLGRRVRRAHLGGGATHLQE